MKAPIKAAELPVFLLFGAHSPAWAGVGQRLHICRAQPAQGWRSASAHRRAFWHRWLGSANARLKKLGGYCRMHRWDEVPVMNALVIGPDVDSHIHM